MRRLAVLAALVPALAAPGALAQPIGTRRAPARPAATPEASIRRADVEAHLRFLASDELMGRAPGTPGIDAAARYIAEQFRRAGVRPVPGASDYFQRFVLARVAPATSGTFTVGTDTLRLGPGLGVLGGGAVDASGEAVYVGAGLTPADYAGKTVRGRIVVTRAGAPGETNPRSIVDLAARKARLADSLGAAALVELYDGALPWTALGRFFGQTRTTTDTPGRLPLAWANDAGGRLRAAVEARTAPRVRLATGGVRASAIRVQNVLGWIPGRDPRLAPEVVLLTAHHDHLGAGLRAGTDATPADSIFNGASDNGTGTVALLAAAEALAAAPPKRSVLLASVTAEEIGLIGSRHLAAHLPVPMARLVFNLNVDTGGISDTAVVSLVGAPRTTARPLVEAAMRAHGLAPYAAAEIEPLFNASDNVPFAAAGVPAATFSPGFRSLRDPEVARVYHRAADNPDARYPFGYLLKFSRAYAAAARALADAPARPAWTPGDANEPAARALYGPAAR